jgi:hypothetical protein
MRKLALTFLALAGLAGVFFVHEARAADFYKETLQPGADAGTLANATLDIGGQAMIRCDNHAVKYKLCEPNRTCAATANDSQIDANQSIDICGLNNFTKLSLYRQYDGGVPTCRVFSVNPRSPQCAQ